jgi:hypothetical protein
MGTAPLRTKEKPPIRDPDQGFLLVAGAGFEPATFRL